MNVSLLHHACTITTATTETDGQTDTDTDRQTDIQTDRQTDRDKDRDRTSACCVWPNTVGLTQLQRTSQSRNFRLRQWQSTLKFSLMGMVYSAGVGDGPGQRRGQDHHVLQPGRQLRGAGHHERLAPPVHRHLQGQHPATRAYGHGIIITLTFSPFPDKEFLHYTF